MPTVTFNAGRTEASLANDGQQQVNVIIRGDESGDPISGLYGMPLAGIDVYLDAVFFPLISEDTFRQEGWHYEREASQGPMVFKGVVFNEMKGAYSSAAAVLGKHAPHMSQFKRGDKVFFRARYIGFEAQAAATDACTELKRLEIDCLVMRAE